MGAPLALASLSFDDGNESDFTVAAPILEGLGVRATFFVITDWIGRPAHLTAEQILLLQALGHEIGNHTRSHPHLDLVSWERARSEIEGAQDDLHRLGIDPVQSFAYPSDSGWSRRDVRALVRNTFEVARASGFGYNAPSGDPALLRSMPLYFREPTAQPHLERIDRTDFPGPVWMSYHTHDVSSEPSLHGCRPEELRRLVEGLLARGFEILPLREAGERWEAFA